MLHSRARAGPEAFGDSFLAGDEAPQLSRSACGDARKPAARMTPPAVVTAIEREKGLARCTCDASGTGGQASSATKRQVAAIHDITDDRVITFPL
jgi:hypothetical protein